MSTQNSTATSTLQANLMQLPKCFILIITFILCSITTFSQVTSFSKIVRNIDSLFNKNPCLLVYENYSFGDAFYKLKINGVVLSYDINTTTSLINPYIGKIILFVSVNSNIKAGNYVSKYGIIGFKDSISAKDNNTLLPSCQPSTADNFEYSKGTIELYYNYSNGIWIFNSVKTETDTKIFCGLLRTQIKNFIYKIIP